MKHAKFIAAAVAAVGILAAGSAMAKQGYGGFGHKASFQELDADGNGEVTKAEMQAHKAARFTEADTNGDGKLSPEEMQAMMQKRAGKRMAKMIERFDTDGDGALSQSELPEGKRHGDMFQRMDQDESGGISQEEFDQAKSRFGKRHGRKCGSEQN
ncbi:EF hand domain protein [Roseobacter sp. SK209-2-6]|uniref:EF-hand domain-containing protein n=1 Tax=Roseobacter sp. SK209-2-6 TaxID=388739 RepID=UPI0000F3EDBB|nr:EF-hand domain-containing protein [Roseobacter sp. SK209-2-6]EBA16686.1 EF hand domain protein [Roseobacter sp. SK209-2-6]